MADIIVAGNTSGAITISAPLVAGSGTLTLPVATDTLAGIAATQTLTNKTLTSPTITGATITVAATAAPAFSAYASTNTSLVNNTNTKILFATEEFDTNSNFDSSRFTPTVAGYYQINACVYSASSLGALELLIYKSGTLYKAGALINGVAAIGAIATVSALVYCNGSTDYIEIYAVQNSGGATNSQALQAYTYFDGSMVRSA